MLDLMFLVSKKKTEWVPMIDESYVFDESNTRSILAGFMFNRRL